MQNERTHIVLIIRGGEKTSYSHERIPHDDDDLCFGEVTINLKPKPKAWSEPQESFPKTTLKTLFYTTAACILRPDSGSQGSVESFLRSLLEPQTCAVFLLVFLCKWSLLCQALKLEDPYRKPLCLRPQ